MVTQHSLPCTAPRVTFLSPSTTQDRPPIKSSLRRPSSANPNRPPETAGSRSQARPRGPTLRVVVPEPSRPWGAWAPEDAVASSIAHLETRRPATRKVPPARPTTAEERLRARLKGPVSFLIEEGSGEGLDDEELERVEEDEGSDLECLEEGDSSSEEADQGGGRGERAGAEAEEGGSGLQRAKREREKLLAQLAQVDARIDARNVGGGGGGEPPRRKQHRLQGVSLSPGSSTDEEASESDSLRSSFDPSSQSESPSLSPPPPPPPPPAAGVSESCSPLLDHRHGRMGRALASREGKAGRHPRYTQGHRFRASDSDRASDSGGNKGLALGPCLPFFLFLDLIGAR